MTTPRTILLSAALAGATLPAPVFAQDDALRPDWLIPGAEPVDRIDPRGDPDAAREQIERRFEESLGVDIEEMRNMSRAQLMLRILTGGGDREADAQGAGENLGVAEPALYDAPRNEDTDPGNRLPATPPPGGFPDHASPLEVTDTAQVSLRIAEPAGRELILVVADPGAERVLLNELVRLPVDRVIDLAALSPESYDVVIELLDPDSHRMVHRFHPVEGGSPDP